jgi:hypothetical protein
VFSANDKLRDKFQCSSSRRAVKVIPVDGALAGAGTEDCWVLGWKYTRYDLSEPE